MLPCMVWLSGLGIILQSERLPVPFPVRAHAWIAGQVPIWGHARSNQSVSLSHTDFSLPHFLPAFPSL